MLTEYAVTCQTRFKYFPYHFQCQVSKSSSKQKNEISEILQVLAASLLLHKNKFYKYVTLRN